MHSSGRGPLHLCVSALWLGETSTKRQVSTKRPEKKKPLVEEGPVALAACPNKHQSPMIKVSLFISPQVATHSEACPRPVPL